MVLVDKIEQALIVGEFQNVQCTPTCNKMHGHVRKDRIVCASCHSTFTINTIILCVMMFILSFCKFEPERQFLKHPLQIQHFIKREICLRLPFIFGVFFLTLV